MALPPSAHIIAALALAFACNGDDDDIGESEGSSSSVSDSGGSSSAGETSDDSIQELCVDTINDYRAGLGLPAYKRWESAEGCTDDQAESDAKSGSSHGAFGACKEWAQNECPGWPSADPENSLLGCLEQMWAEGPGEDFSAHGHYINMSSESYTQVACGFYTTDDGKLWAIQNFQ